MNNVATLPCETWPSRFVNEQQLKLRTQNTSNVLSHRLQNRADSDKVLYLL